MVKKIINIKNNNGTKTKGDEATSKIELLKKEYLSCGIIIKAFIISVIGKLSIYPVTKVYFPVFDGL